MPCQPNLLNKVPPKHRWRHTVFQCRDVVYTRFACLLISKVEIDILGLVHVTLDRKTKTKLIILNVCYKSIQKVI